MDKSHQRSRTRIQLDASVISRGYVINSLLNKVRCITLTLSFLSLQDQHANSPCDCNTSSRAPDCFVALPCLAFFFISDSKGIHKRGYMYIASSQEIYDITRIVKQPGESQEKKTTAATATKTTNKTCKHDIKGLSLGGSRKGGILSFCGPLFNKPAPPSPIHSSSNKSA